MKYPEFVQQKPRQKMGIRWGIFAGFAVFTLVIIVLLWVFQITLLESFYRSTKIDEIRSTGDTIVSQMQNENMNLFRMEEVITNAAQEKQMSILLSDERGQWTILKKSSPHILSGSADLGGTGADLYADGIHGRPVSLQPE